MANRKSLFGIGEHYHVYNRGVDKRTIFTDTYDAHRFIKSMVEFNTIDPTGSLYELSFLQRGGFTPKSSEKLVNIIAYCLNPNHFHFILEQLADGGISEFMKRLGGGYTSYFNQKYERSGSLFQGVFKDVHIDSNEYLLHVSAYVNLNNIVHKHGAEGENLIESMSSWKEYVANSSSGICAKEIILEQFSSVDQYKDFAMSSIESTLEMRQELKDFHKVLLEQFA